MVLFNWAQSNLQQTTKTVKWNMAQFWWSALREEFTICYQVKLLSFEPPFSAKRKNFASLNQLFLGPSLGGLLSINSHLRSGFLLQMFLWALNLPTHWMLLVWDKLQLIWTNSILLVYTDASKPSEPSDLVAFQQIQLSHDGSGIHGFDI